MRASHASDRQHICKRCGSAVDLSTVEIIRTPTGEIVACPPCGYVQYIESVRH